MSCELCNIRDGFIVTICHTCPDNVKLLVSLTHKPEFSSDEKMKIALMFPNSKIRWEMRHPEIGHAHCHIEEK